MITCNKVIKIGMQVACSVGICVSLTGCFGSKPEPALPDFKPKALDDKARGITIASSKPYNCKVVGETEGHDEVEGKVANVTKAKIRLGAINDLKNESVHAIKEGQKVMIAIAKEEMMCKRYPVDKKGRVQWNVPAKEVECTNVDPIPQNMKIASFKVYGDLYDCGAK